MSQVRLVKIGRDFQRWIVEAMYEIADAINGKLWPSSNFLQFVTRGTTPGAGVEFTITHGLKRGRPYQDSAGAWHGGVEFTYWLDGAGTLYESDFANWTDDAIKLKCTDAGRGYTIIIR